MSSKMATYFYNKYKDKYKCVLHCSNADDKLKKQLKDVNNFWDKFDLVIYSPSVESGVSFNKEHFDKLYVVLSSKSTSPRAVMQMCSRVRKIKDPQVDVYLNNLPFREKSNFYTYSDIKEYVCELYTKYFEPKYVYEPNIGKNVVKYEYNLYAKILIHNELENANKCSNFFVPYLIKLLTDKGHTYEYNNTKFSRKAINKDIILKDEIIKAKDIDDKQLNILLSKQKGNMATHEDKMIIQKHLYKENWKVDELTTEFMDKYCGKTSTLLNLRYLLDENKISELHKDPHNKFDNSRKVEEITMIKDVINKLGFDKPADEKLIDKITFENNINKVKKECDLFTKPNRSLPIFEFNKAKLNNIKTTKQFLGFVNTVFSQWGIIIKQKRKIKKIKINDKWKSNANNFFKLEYINQINKYI